MEALIMLVSVVFVIGLYFLPTILATRNKKRNVAAIKALNFLTGWTVVGWIVALVWALTVDK